MAFTAANFIANESANTSAGDVFHYKESTATLAAMAAQSYFDDAAETLGLKDDDIILMKGSDGVAYCIMEITAGVVDVTTTSYVSSNSVSQVIVTDSTLTPTTAQSGTTFILANADGVAVTLPAVATGLTYTFIQGTPVLTSADSHVITATDKVIQGSFVLGGEVQLVAVHDTITMPHTVSILGDKCTIRADATNWYTTGMGSTDDSILGTDES